MPIDIDWEDWVKPNENSIAPVSKATRYELEEIAFEPRALEAISELFDYFPNSSDIGEDRNWLALERNQDDDYATIYLQNEHWNQRFRDFANEIILIPAEKNDGEIYLDAIAEDRVTELVNISVNIFGTSRKWKINRWTVEKDHDIVTNDPFTLDTVHFTHTDRYKVIVSYPWNRYIEIGG